MFQRILVANRGEIALRVIRACKELGVEVVAVYSQADRDAPYLALADRAICIGKAASADSYLNIPRIIAAAEVADVQAIHPGYGFLSENPHFAEICRSCNFEFIGPPHEAIRKMGLKTEAKAVAAAAKVALRPRLRRPRRQRRRGPPAGADDRLPRADQGRGRRRRQGDAGLPRGDDPRRLAPGRAERGRGRVQERERLPREVHRPAPARRDPDPGRQPRQRRPLLGPRLLAPAAASEARRGVARPDPAARRSAPGSARPPSGSPRPPATSTRAPASSSSTPTTTSTSSRSTPGSRSSTRSPRWSPASTWSSSRSGSPRASSCRSRSPRSQTRGHSFECRINSEDPDNDFRPSPGKITALRIPGGPGVRWDSHVQVGYTVPPNYDSLVGKLIVHAPDPRRGDRRHAAGPRRAGRRGDPDHDPAPPPDLPQPRLHRGPGRHHLGRAGPDGPQTEPCDPLSPRRRAGGPWNHPLRAW